ncbi:hypothetical protein DES53_114140 [Roseimicrobium gellanilyticum]|uniref:MotA/TolQ/ExbB proton channel family protein n=1 Tax=Roseimicrobium gellanilyticum TaxID=748857 RepID=A0A366H640_9BACT|nr:hypothetical protein [Roseimicrobium gellanilyticum]RBP37402.1 hypothetical protein DES53_114140 [Roseimicrobium gellanilyticum]
MEPLPSPEHPVVVYKPSLLGLLQEGGLSAWVILFLALLLFALFVTSLVGRRSVSSIIAYFAAAFLPLMVGLCGVAAGAIAAFENLGTAGVADPAHLSAAMGRIIFSLLMGAAVTFLGLIGTVVLALVGPSKVVTPPPVPQ